MGRRSTPRPEIVSLGDVRKETEGDHIKLVAEAVVRDAGGIIRTTQVEQIGNFLYRFDKQPHFGLPRIARQRTHRGRPLFRGQARREDDPSIAGYNRVGIWKER